MEVRITTRRATVGEAFLRKAEERVRKLARYEPRIHAVALTVDEDRGRVTVEARAEVPGAPPMVASSQADSSRAALDRTIQKVQRQLRKRRAKRLDHKAPPSQALAE